jgi:hypothetical protein
MANKIKNDLVTQPAELDVRYVPLNAVHQWADNPWKHDNAIPRLAELMVMNGQRTPVEVWRKNHTIYKGNHTHKALMYLAQPGQLAKVLKAAGIAPHESLLVCDERDGSPLIKAQYNDFLSEAAANAYGLSDNNSSQGGEYDDALLHKLLTTDEAYYNTQRTGFTEKERKAFLLGTQSDLAALEKINLEGDSMALGDFLILQFDDAETFQQFKTTMGLRKQERTITYAKLCKEFSK